MTNNKVEIILISQSANTTTAIGTLDVSIDAEVPFTFSVGDIRDLSQRKGTFSKTIKLAGTKNNNILLNHYFDVNIQAGTFDLNKIQMIQVLQNGIPILKNAYLQLISVVKSVNSVTNQDNIQYEAVIKDNVGDLFSKLNNKELSDLDFSEFDHVLTADYVRGTFTNTFASGFKYFLPYKENQLSYNLADFKPALYAKTIFDKIFQRAGYTYEWTNSDDVNFSNLLIPYNGDKLTVDQQDLDRIRVIATRSLTDPAQVVSGSTRVRTTNTLVGQQFFFADTYDNQFFINNGATLNFSLDITFDAGIVNLESQAIDLVDSSQFPSPTPRYDAIVPWVSVERNFNEFIFGQNFYDVVNPDLKISAGTELAVGENVLFTNVRRIININLTDVNPNTFFRLFYNCTNIGNQPGVNWRLSSFPSSSLAQIQKFIRVKEARLVITPNIQSIGFNSVLRMNKIVPKKIKQSDFLKSIFMMFNLYTIVDPNNENNIIIQTRDEFYDSGDEKDWSTKLAKDKEQIITFLPTLASKKIILTYKQDDNDELLKSYRNSTGEIYGQVEFTYDNEYVKGTDTKEIIFSPVVPVKNNNGWVLPAINGVEPKTNIKIGLNSKQYQVTQPYTIFNTVDPNFSGTTSVTGNTIPLVSHMNDGELPDFDLNFGLNDYHYYDVVPTNNNLFNLHWRRTINQINTGKLFTAFFKLNEADINNLKLNDKIWVIDSWWNINQIIDYKAGKNELTKVELISIDDELEFSQFITKSTFSLSNSDSGFQALRDYNENYELSTNVINTTSPVQIQGFNNVIGDNVSGQIIGSNNIIESSGLIIGSNNTISVEAENTFVIGSNISATTSNTLYAENIIIPSGGTINGVPIEQILNNSNIMTTIKIDIGPWDMVTNPFTNVPHGLSSTEWLTINNIRVLIVNDAQTIMYDYQHTLNDGAYDINGTGSASSWESSSAFPGGGTINLNATLDPVLTTYITYTRTNSTNIELRRKDYFFYNAGFTSTSNNRGYIILDYIAD